MKQLLGIILILLLVGCSKPAPVQRGSTIEHLEKEDIFRVTKYYGDHPLVSDYGYNKPCIKDDEEMWSILQLMVAFQYLNYSARQEYLGKAHCIFKYEEDK